jgi:CO/xanthine dehydrogenase FAD-binding subunit
MHLVRPSSLSDALDALAEPGAQAIAGGTALQLTWEAGAKKPGTLVDLSALSELSGVSEHAEAMHIGALTSLAELMQNVLIIEHLPLLARATRDVAGPSVRTMGTLGGQIGWGNGCLLPALIALDAQVVVAAKADDHTQLLADYLVGGGDALIVAVRIPKQTSRHWVWQKIGLRAAFTPGVIAVAAVWKQQDGLFADLRLSAGSGTTPPQRLTAVEEALDGKSSKDVYESTIARAIQAPDDPLQTGAYRKRVGAAALAAGLRSCPCRQCHLRVGCRHPSQQPRVSDCFRARLPMATGTYERTWMTGSTARRYFFPMRAVSTCWSGLFCAHPTHTPNCSRLTRARPKHCQASMRW